MENKEKIILEAMEKAGKPLKNAEVAAITGLDPKEVGKIVTAMKKKGKVTSPKNCYYEPTK
ncbi:MAG: MarR family transcriptional regulator [Magnetococcales bacterium]|nr:MarR family transcriptional regulator [Magnetococcales bacterium]MBF0630961.1 MarR family transcriptional regulator [Magnetococcales bacterium]